jgi:hypothetical protein
MADEKVNRKRQTVKPDVVNTAIQGAQRPTGRPALQFIQDILGYTLEGGLLDMYHGGYFDDCDGLPGSGSNGHTGPLTAEMVREYAAGFVKSELQAAAQRKRAEMKREAARVAEAARRAAIDPAAYTCTRCTKQFEFLKTQPVKLCGDCAIAVMEETQAD